VTELAVMLALGSDCLADVAVLRAEPALFGPVASDPAVSRLIARLAADGLRALKAIARPGPTGRKRACPAEYVPAVRSAGQILSQWSGFRPVQQDRA
jgi:hypothetical protein